MESEFGKEMTKKRGRPKKNVSIVKKKKEPVICGGEYMCKAVKQCAYEGRFGSTSCCGYYDVFGTPRTLEPDGAIIGGRCGLFRQKTGRKLKNLHEEDWNKINI